MRNPFRGLVSNIASVRELSDADLRLVSGGEGGDGDGGSDGGSGSGSCDASNSDTCGGMNAVDCGTTSSDVDTGNGAPGCTCDMVSNCGYD
jgi:hypothetical protein